MYYITIMLIAASVSSCSKKKNDTEQPQQNRQMQSSDIQEKDHAAKMQIVPVPNPDVIVLDADHSITNITVDEVFQKASEQIKKTTTNEHE